MFSEREGRKESSLTTPLHMKVCCSSDFLISQQLLLLILQPSTSSIWWHLFHSALLSLPIFSPTVFLGCLSLAYISAGAKQAQIQRFPYNTANITWTAFCCFFIYFLFRETGSRFPREKIKNLDWFGYSKIHNRGRFELEDIQLKILDLPQCHQLF